MVALLGGRAGADAPPAGLAPCPIVDRMPLAADADEELRWPLDRTPELDPRIDLDAALHVAHWADACGLVRPPEHLAAYVRGWCAMHAADLDRALDGLGEAAASKRDVVALAACRDLVDVLAGKLRVGDAFAWLDKHHLATDDLLDRLATTYLASGQTSDAVELERQLVPDGKQREDVRCHRTARRAREGLPVGGIEHGCEALVDLASCPLATGSYLATSWTLPSDLHDRVAEDIGHCDAIRWRDSRTSAQAHLWLVAMAARWPGAGASANRWLTYARVATMSWHTSEVEVFALTAIDNAIVAGGCSAAPDAREAARDLKYLPDHDRALDSRIDAVGAGC